MNMKSFFVSMVPALGLLLPGCATNRSGLVLDSVGPSPEYSSAAGSGGSLVVFSAFDTSLRFSDDPYRKRCTDYKLFSDDGKLLRMVHNDSDTLLEGPVSVALPAGRYRVSARANGYGSVTVPVVILAQRTTTVHLEGGASWPDRTTLASSNPVRLPDGQIIGWRADQPSPLSVSLVRP